MKYRKKPIVVEAKQFTNESKDSVYRWASSIRMNVEPSTREGKPVLLIPTLEGEMVASLGDYIIQGVSGEIYPCKPDIFEKTYELADATPSESAMEMVAKIRQTHTVCSLDQFRGKPISYLSFDIHDSDAAALIEGLQRRVPRAMLDDVAEVEAGLIQYYGEYTKLTDNSKNSIAAKYGVVIE